MMRLFYLSLAHPRAYRNIGLWLIATYGVLRITDLPGDGGLKVLCGPWGCLPSLQSLVAAHGFWLMVIVPALIWAQHRYSTERLAWLGIALIAVGGIGIGVTVIRSLLAWGPLTPDRPWWHPALHALFDVAMFVDLPLVELVVAGATCIMIVLVRWKKRRLGGTCRPSSSDGLLAPGSFSDQSNIKNSRYATSQ